MLRRMRRRWSMTDGSTTVVGRRREVRSRYRGQSSGSGPVDRHHRSAQRSGQHFVDMADVNDLQTALDRIGYLDEILLVLGGDQHLLDAAPKRRQQFFLKAADRKDTAAQRYLAGHGNVTSHGDAGQCRYD